MSDFYIVYESKRRKNAIKGMHISAPTAKDAYDTAKLNEDVERFIEILRLDEYSFAKYQDRKKMVEKSEEESIVYQMMEAPSNESACFVRYEDGYAEVNLDVKAKSLKTGKKVIGRRIYDHNFEVYALMDPDTKEVTKIDPKTIKSVGFIDKRLFPEFKKRKEA